MSGAKCLSVVTPDHRAQAELARNGGDSRACSAGRWGDPNVDAR